MLPAAGAILETGGRLTDPADQYQRFAGQMWVAPDAVSWTRLTGGCHASISLGGAPAEAGAHVLIKHGLRSSELGSVMVMWDGERVANLDLSGTGHTDAVIGRRIETPHYQWIDEKGRKRARPVDCAAEGIGGLRDAFYWFLKHEQIAGQPRWTEPPLAPPLPTPGRPGPRKRKSR